MMKTNFFKSKKNQLIKAASVFFLSGLSITLSGQATTNLALHNEVDHVQPMTGIVFWAENDGDLRTLGNKTQLEFSYLIYSDVINEEGIYDWGVVDDLLETAADRGRQIIVRFRYTYPGQTKVSVPEYVMESNDYTAHSLTKVEGSNTFIPDWTSASLEDFTLEFYTKFAERYDNDSRLAFLQMGFGSYSEYHLYDGPSNPIANGYFPSKDFQATFLNHVDSEFENTQWTISIDAAGSEYTPLESNSALRSLGFGLFDDSFLHEEHSENDNEYNRESWLLFGEDRADDFVAGGELNYYSDYDQRNVLKPVEGPWGTSYETLSEMYDITYMIGNDQLNYQSAARIEEAGMANGYHYEVTEFKTDGNETTVTIKNNGIAPIYYDAYPTVGGVRSTESLKGVVAGESKTFTIAAEGINEDLEIECDRMVSGQEIQFDADLEASITGVESNTLGFEINAFPNPNNGQLLTITKGSGTQVDLRLLSLSGEVILEKSLNSLTQQIDLNNLNKGSYVLEMTTPSAVSTSLFVVQ